MDISKELAQFYSGDYDNLTNYLEEEKARTKKKQYIFMILDTARTLQNHMDNNVFSHLSSVSLKHTYDEDFGGSYEIVHCLDKNNNPTKHFGTQEHQTIDENFGMHNFCVEEEFYPGPCNKEIITINFNAPIKEQLVEIFLNEELKAILNYAHLTLYVSDEKFTNQPKVKM